MRVTRFSGIAVEGHCNFAIVASCSANALGAQWVWHHQISSIRSRCDRSVRNDPPLHGCGGLSGYAGSALHHCDLRTGRDSSAGARRGPGVVFDAATLQYWAAKQREGLVQVVGPSFRPQKYAIAVPVCRASFIAPFQSQSGYPRTSESRQHISCRAHVRRRAKIPPSPGSARSTKRPESVSEWLPRRLLVRLKLLIFQSPKVKHEVVRP